MHPEPVALARGSYGVLTGSKPTSGRGVTGLITFRSAPSITRVKYTIAHARNGKVEGDRSGQRVPAKYWLATPPPCDQLHYNYTITDCDKHSRRQVTFLWKVADNGASSECTGGIPLPPPTSVLCSTTCPRPSPRYSPLSCCVLAHAN
ncbi:hypothetical protein H257_01169 [Aphanomyces astaci]|uniref:Uncharacterized protein n=1 Tax=Aphanomyces astaci TaxID=112090 RepID=W4H723_APHAT|nr:hypothetical protein H257_01169 [Aphanomyces astaci]ETV87682.1 hypothetical protein H257_01169 [Aphanomyces astaci]|eukprot:XP_009822545.1 hypothetical protein H257_01169 [Aphanomyces astaci]